MNSFGNASDCGGADASDAALWREYRSRGFAPTTVRKRGIGSTGVLLLGVCLLLVVVAGCISVWLASGSPELPEAGASPNQSTPQAEWTQGVMPSLYQTDPQWRDHPYAESKFGESGCGPTCLAMVYVFLTGDQTVSPTDIADMAERLNCAGPEGTSWLFMTEGASQLGIQGEAITLEEDFVRDQLSAGHPIICSMGPGDFTSVGHFIVLEGIDGNGKVTVRDPNSIERSSQAWNLETIQEQYVNAWVFGV